MKFKAEPNFYVRFANKYVQRVTGLKGFYFDDKGEYSTENQTIANILKQHFEVIQDELKHCKKCNFTCDNQGELLAHYRKEHPKEE